MYRYNKYVSFICLLLACVLFMGTPAFAGQDDQGCFSVIAGKLTTADGSVLFAHNEDNGYGCITGMFKVERVVHAPGETVEFTDGDGNPTGVVIAQVDTTYAYWRSKMPGSSNSDGYLNEFGVGIVSNNCPSREDAAEIVDGGARGPVLRRLVAERAKTAREGAKLVGSLVDTYGYTFQGRVLVIADPNEGYLVHIVQGKHWLAQRVPDDKVAAIANTYTIQEVDLADTLNFFGSADIIDYAISRGWYNEADGPFNFEQVYAESGSRTAVSNTHRLWGGFRHLVTSLPVPEEEHIPFCADPKGPLTVQDMIEAVTDHYENSTYDPDDYVTAPAHSRHTTTVCGEWCNTSNILQLRSDMPADVGALWWVALWHPCKSVFAPLWFGIDDLPALNFSNNDGNTAGWSYSTFENLCKWVDEDYAGRIPLVREYFDPLQEECFTMQTSLENAGNIASLTSYAASVLDRATVDANSLMGITEVEEASPVSFSLSQNIPNPFNPTTTISYTIPDCSSAPATLKVFDIRGALVRTLVNEVKSQGSYSIEWNGLDETGKQVSAGVYLYKLEAGKYSQTKKMLLLK